MSCTKCPQKLDNSRFNVVQANCINVHKASTKCLSLPCPQVIDIIDPDAVTYTQSVTDVRSDNNPRTITLDSSDPVNIPVGKLKYIEHTAGAGDVTVVSAQLPPEFDPVVLPLGYGACWNFQNGRWI